MFKDLKPVDMVLLMVALTACFSFGAATLGYKGMAEETFKNLAVMVLTYFFTKEIPGKGEN